jgi:predicted porin
MKPVVKCLRACAAVALAVCPLLTATPARAEVTIAEASGFRFFTDGRVNTFASMGFGDDFPAASPNTDGGPTHSLIGESSAYAHGQNTDQDDVAGKYFAIRGRNGFVATILGLGMRSNLTATTSVKGYISLWGHAETFNRDRANLSQKTFDVREGYAEFQGPWGAFTAGRQLGLFGRMSTQIDASYGHNFGLGYPCGDKQGPACGHIGTGVMFPGFAAGFQYSTPALAGLQLHVGVYDPVRLLGAWNRATVVRPEGAISFEQKFAANGLVKLQVEGLWQQLSRLEASTSTPGNTDLRKDSVWGVAGGGRFELGPVRLGASFFHGKGLGTYYALQNSPAAFNANTFNLRRFTGVYGQGALVFGNLQLAAGVGKVGIKQLREDPLDLETSHAKSQLGVSAAVYYSVSENLVLGLDYFRLQADWWGAPRSTVDANMMTVALPGYLPPERQVVNYINAGATFHW